MNKVTYNQQKRYSRYDEGRYLVYLNETFESLLSDAGESDGEGFAYEGNESDGGTLINAPDASYPDFVSGLIRSRYSPDSVEAINANRMTALINPLHENADRYVSEWETYQAFRSQCKNDAKYLLGMTELEG